MINLGIPRQNFLDEYFEKKLRICKGAILRHGIEWRHINDALYSWDPRDGLIHLYRNGSVPLESYTESFLDIGLSRLRIVKDVFNSHMRNGATLVMNRIDTKLMPMQQLTREFSRLVGEKAVANAYAAFGGDGTFSKHWDTHDVFALQLIGRKRWKVYEPTFPLPLPHQKSRDHKHECPAAPVFDDILEAGDVLYIPRGWWHEAIPLENQETLHIAVGIHTAHIVDYIAWSCRNTLTSELAFRQSLKFESDNRLAIDSALDQIRELLLSPENISLYKQAQASEERWISDFDIAGNVANPDPSTGKRKTLSVNSAYRTLERRARTVPVNGVAISIDERSAATLGPLFHEGEIALEELIRNADPGSVTSINNLLNELHRNDIISLSYS